MRKMIVRDRFLQEALTGERMLIEDGGMGSMLMAVGGDVARMSPAEANLAAPEAVQPVQEAYVRAGSQLIIANSFTSNALKMGDAEAAVTSTEAAVRIAHAAVDAAWRPDAGIRPYIAGDMGPTGQLLEPFGDLEPEEAYEAFAAQARVFHQMGVDVVCVETMTSLEEAQEAVRAACAETRVPVFATMSFEANGRTFMGVSPEEAVHGLEDAGANAVGVNCSLAPHEMVDVVSAMRAVASVPLIAKPNAGLPKLVNGRTEYDVTPDEFAQQMRQLIEAGATILGGCCGTTPDFIKALIQQQDVVWQSATL